MKRRAKEQIREKQLEYERKIQEKCLDYLDYVFSNGKSIDAFSEALIPNDCPVPDYKAVKTKGDGSCLFNVVSNAICGKHFIFNRNGNWK